MSKLFIQFADPNNDLEFSDGEIKGGVHKLWCKIYLEQEGIILIEPTTKYKFAIRADKIEYISYLED